VCHAVQRIVTRTRVVILQHPRERDVPINTARLAELQLEGAERFVGIRLAQQPTLRARLGDPARPAILLYPGEGDLVAGQEALPTQPRARGAAALCARSAVA
jgi:DTW domain-containing protein YfiP